MLLVSASLFILVKVWCGGFELIGTDSLSQILRLANVPLQGRCRAIANKMPNGTRNVIGHMTTDLGPVRATCKKYIYIFLSESPIGKLVA